MDKTRLHEQYERGEEAEQAFLRPGIHVHLVGIGGSGMSAIAWVLIGYGYKVSGSDIRRNDMTAMLEEAGARVFEGHRAEHISEADLVVISSAVPPDNVEVRAARERQIPVWKRADLLGQLMKDQTGIAVAGTHGKTTTTSMIAHILLESGEDPSVIVGGLLPELGRNGRAGDGELMVVEADEYDYMFLGLWPRIAVVTNIEHDHPDLFATPDDYLNAFEQFVERLSDDGTLVCCTDDGGVQALLERWAHRDNRLIAYGLAAYEAEPSSGYRALDLQPNQLGGTDFVVMHGGETLGVARLRIPGEHNVLNALAAIAVCREQQIPFSRIVQALISFGGVGRRFQVVGEAGDCTVIDDYAHHPTEIRVTLAAARQRFPGRRLWAVWQPHTYSRTRLLSQEFAASFEHADRVIVLDVYRSRETDTLGVDAAHLVAEMAHPYARHIGSRQDAADFVLDRIRPGDVVLTLGAGDGDAVGVWILEGLKQRLEPERQEGSDGPK